MEAETYNGWSNYETWCVALWLDNDEATHRHMRELAEQAWNEAPHNRRVREWKWTREEAAVFQLADETRESVEQGNPVEGATLYTDLMNAALAEVNWQEIAAQYV